MTATSTSPARPVPAWATAGAAAVGSLLPSTATLLYFVALWDFSPSVQQSACVATKLVQFGFPVVWLLLVERRQPRPPARWRSGIGEGVGAGALVLAGSLALYHLWLGPAGVFDGPTAAMREKLTGLGVDALGRYLAFAVLVSTVHALLEEYYFRWFVFGQMRRLLPLPTALVLASVAFAAHHMIVLAMYFGWASPWTWMFSLAVAVGGAYWAWLYER
ncbi:MAG: type II CAAX prenyl endopeptidase Rce1 family protein, partial [Pirellulales bacterium]